MKSQFTPELALVDEDLADVLRSYLSAPGDCLAERLPGRTVTPAHGPVLAPPARVSAPTADGVESNRPVPTSLPVAAGGTRARLQPVPDLAPPRPVAIPRDVSLPQRRRLAGHLGFWVTALAIFAVPMLAFVPASGNNRPSFAVDAGVSPETRSAGGREAGSDRPAPRTAPERAAVPSRKPPSAPPETSVRTTRPLAKPKPKTAAAARPRQSARRQRSDGLNDRRAAAGTIRWPAVRGASDYNLVFVRGGERIVRYVGTTSARVASTAAAGEVSRYAWYVFPVFKNPNGYRIGKLLARGSVRASESSLPGRSDLGVQ